MDCVILLDVNPLEQFVFSVGANDTIHKGAVRLSVYDYFFQIRQLQRLRYAPKMHLNEKYEVMMNLYVC